ncbi:hypothetical protein RQP46_003565 [Phenoliferia psychrophenolica]
MHYNKPSRITFANLCYLQLVVADGCGPALLQWQKLPKMKIKEQNLITQADLDLSADLVKLFEPMFDLTPEVSKDDQPVIGDVILWIDSLQGHFDRILGVD